MSNPEETYIVRPYQRVAGLVAILLNTILVAVIVLSTISFETKHAGIGRAETGLEWDSSLGSVSQPKNLILETMSIPMEVASPAALFKDVDAFFPRNGWSIVAPLEDFSSSAAALAELSQIAPSIAIVDIRNGDVYSFNGHRDHNLLSVAKIPILLAVLENAQNSQVTLTESEKQWLEWMISVSDNRATQILWDGLGDTSAVDSLFFDAGLSQPRFAQVDRWGTMRTSSLELAWLLAAVASGRLVNEETYNYATALLSQVEESQQWGVSAGHNDDAGCECSILVKNGWLEVDGLWWLWSAGVAFGTDGKPTYALVVMTDSVEFFGDGVETIEEIASAIHSADKVES